MMPFVPEGTHETFDWKQLIGFVILVFGSLMYNEILVFPCGGFDQNTKEAIKARKKKEEEEGIEHDQIEPTIPVDTSTDKPIEPEKEEAPPVVVNDNKVLKLIILRNINVNNTLYLYFLHYNFIMI